MAAHDDAGNGFAQLVVYILSGDSIVPPPKAPE